MATMGCRFVWERFAGAAYLAWLGIKLIRALIEGVNADVPAADLLAFGATFYISGWYILFR